MLTVLYKFEFVKERAPPPHPHPTPGVTYIANNGLLIGDQGTDVPGSLVGLQDLWTIVSAAFNPGLGPSHTSASHSL